MVLKMKCTVLENKSNGQKLITLPVRSNIKKGDVVFVSTEE